MPCVVLFSVHGVPFWGRFWCAVRRFWAPFWCTVCGAPILAPISVHVRLFGFDFGALPFRDRFWCVVRWCWGRSQPAGNKIYKDWRGPGGNRARDLSNMGPWSWRMMPFRVDFGARCAFSGSVLVCGAPFLGWILVRGAPFLGWILVRGMWCADFGADFGARCVVFGLDFGAVCVVRRFWGRFRCAVCGAPILGPISVHGVPFWGHFWCVARRFWARFWCTVCGAPILGRISLHGATFWVRFWRVAFLGSILRWCWGRSQPAGNKNLSRLERIWKESSARSVEYGALVLAHDALLGGVWCEVRLFGLGFGVRCAVFGLDFGARYVVRRFWARFWCAVCGAPIFGPISVHSAPFWARKIGEDLGGIKPETCRIWGLGRGACCPFGWILVRGAPFLGWILVRGAPFLGWILVRGMWCADFRADFGARCVVFGLDFGARCAVFGLDFGARCVVRRFWGRFRCTVCLFGVIFGVWRAVFGLDFGARCVVRRFWGGFRCTVRLFGFDFGALPFWDRFWCVVRWCWGRSQPAGNKIYQNMNILLFGALLGSS